MKVSQKLIVSFLIMVALAIVVGGVGILGMSRISSADEALYNENVVAINAMSAIREALQRQRVGIRNYALYAGDEQQLQTQRATMQTTEKTIDEQFALYESTISDQSEESAYYEGKSLYYKEWATIKDEVYNESLKSFEEGFARLFDPTVVATANKMTDDFTVSMENNSQWAQEAVDSNKNLFRTMLIIEIVVLVISAAIAMVLAFYISGMISKPLIILTAFMNKAAETGDISLRKEDIEVIGRYGQYRDETGQCIGSTAKFIEHITAISGDLDSVANGDISIEVKLLSDVDTMGVSMKKMVDNLNGMFGDINSSTAQVSTGSKQIADGSQALAQGSTQQAAAVEQLSSSISEIAIKTKENADMAANAAHLGDSIRQNAEKGNRQMTEMMDAVKEINLASQNINKVIKVIDDIAFQTNILALNAAVEAARAGQHGKGFAVVAEEVRSLAAKSAEAAKDTGGLIANSMEKAELGARIADETAASLAEIVSGINESSQLVAEIARSSEEQSMGITQINKGIDQVAQVVQQNSATAEESAAASEEMSSQANMLEELISQFKLRNENASRRGLAADARKKLSMPPRTERPSASGEGFGKY